MLSVGCPRTLYIATGQSVPDYSRTFYDHVVGQFLVNAHRNVVTLWQSVLKVRQFSLVALKEKNRRLLKFLESSIIDAYVLISAPVPFPSPVGLDYIVPYVYLFSWG